MKKFLMTLFVSTIGFTAIANAEGEKKSDASSTEAGKSDSMMPTINKDTVQGNWEATKGLIKKKWGELTDNDLMEFEGKVQQLAGIIQKKYGITKEEAQKKAEDFMKENEKASSDSESKK